MQQPPPGPPPEGPSEPSASQPEPTPPPPPAPPPPPPPMTPPSASPPPMYSQPAAAPSSGMSRQTGSLIAYVLGWVTGIIMYFVSNDSEVKFNAAQSIVFFGSLSIINVILGFIPVIHWLSYFVSLFGFICWIILLVRVSQSGGNRVQVPLVGSLVAQYAERIAGAA